MKVFWLGLLVLSTSAFGQRAGGFGGGASRPASGGFAVVRPGAGFRSPGFQRQFGLPQLEPIPPLGGEPFLQRRAPFAGNRFGRLGRGSSFYPLVWPGYFGDEVYSYAPAPNIFVVQPPTLAAFQPAAPAPPPKPAQPVVHEYNFSEAETAPAPPAEQRAFVIALKDGSKASAVAVWVQGRTLHYIDRDDNERQVALSEVDRGLTQKLNREQQLPLSLPAAGPVSGSIP